MQFSVKNNEMVMSKGIIDGAKNEIECARNAVLESLNSGAFAGMEFWNVKEKLNKLMKI